MIEKIQRDQEKRQSLERELIKNDEAVVSERIKRVAFSRDSRIN